MSVIAARNMKSERMHVHSVILRDAPAGRAGRRWSMLRPAGARRRLTWCSAKSGETPALSRNCDGPIDRRTPAEIDPGRSQVACMLR
jgi:hypothetical protein